MLLVSPPFLSNTTAPLWYALGAPATTVSWPCLTKRFPVSKEKPGKPRKRSEPGGRREERSGFLTYPGSCSEESGPNLGSLHSRLRLQKDRHRRCQSLRMCCSSVPNVPFLQESKCLELLRNTNAEARSQKCSLFFFFSSNSIHISSF